MKRTFVTVCATLVLFGVLGFAQAGAQKSAPTAAGKNAAVEQKIQKMEEGLWEAWKKGDTKPFEAALTDDSVSVVGNIDRGKEPALKMISSGACKVNSFSLSDFQFTWIDPTAVVVTYVANQDATCDGKKVPAKVYASSVWAKKGSKWMTPFHQETPAM